MHPGQVEQLAAALHQAAVRFTGSSAVVRDYDTALREIVNGAVATVPGATHAGITVLYPDGTISSTTPTAELVARLDQAQATLGEGPCVDAVQARPQPDSPRDRTGVAAAGARGEPGRDPNSNTRDDPGDRDDRDGQGGRGGAMVHASDLAHADRQRWPRFADEAPRAGVVSIVSFTLSGPHRPATALNLYAEQAEVFDLVARTTAALFADQAAIVLHGAEHAAELNRALDSRDVIGQAKGILMERHRIDAQAAFAMLVEASQHTNIKLRDVANWLTTDPGGEQELQHTR